MPKIIKASQPSATNDAVKVLREGGLVVFPTETCYGIGADATNQKAVDKLLSYKSRREGKPISIAVSDKEMAQDYVEINEIADNLYENYLPGPITVVSRSKSKTAQGIESEYKTLGIRLPDYPLIIEIVKKLGNPITATSANMSYKPRPYSVKALLKNTPLKQLNKIDLILDAGKLPHNEVSTVVDTTLNSLNIIRKGQLAFEKDGDPVAQATTHGPLETESFAASLILKYINRLQDTCLIFALGGELGAGKTQFAKGIAKQLAIDANIKSPTFTLVAEYPHEKVSGGTLVHIDTWRLNDVTELNAISIGSYISPGNVIVIEWADKFYNDIEQLMKTHPSIGLKVSFKVIPPETRIITVEEHNDT